MVAFTRKLCFYKNDVTRGYSNPMRRWVYHYLFGGLIVGGVACVLVQYRLAALEALRGHDDGKYLCSSATMELLLLLPFNYFSYAFGRFAESDYFLESLHRFFINAIVWWYDINISDTKERSFSTLQEFFVREWSAGARPLAPALLTAPSDGVVLSVQEDVQEEQLVQVKGVTYSLRQLFHRDLEPLAEGHKRIAIVLHLRVQDYHHVISPCSFNCSEVIYIPGALLPLTPAGYHWIPLVLPLNERVVVMGKANDHAMRGNICLALVGGTLTGRIALHFDKRIKTNFLNPPEYAVHRKYSSNPLFCKGTLLSTFFWGSSVVLVADVPQNVLLTVKAGNVLKAGEALISY